MSTFEVRIHGRGGQGVVTAAELLSVAAFTEGRHAQAFPSFGSERTGAPVVAFCRISDGPIRTREPIVAPDGRADGSPLSEAAIAWAFEEASIRHAPLVAVYTWHDGDTAGLFSDGNVAFQGESLRDSGRRLLAQRLAGWQEKYPDVVVERRVEHDKPRDRLLGASHEAQLLVVGSRGRGGFSGLVLGSTSQALLHHAACPVMVVRAENA
ncbi:universal stress protein [Amycolatopsis sp. NPDC004378]